MTRRTFLASALASLCSHSPINWIAVDVRGQVQNANWPEADRSVSVGSLLKPFLAVSYLATHAQSPVIDCRGASAGCWLPLGHGRQDLVAALANSCNAYFLQLAENVNRAALDLTCLSYGLASPARAWKASRLIGLGEGWPQTPLAAARAFASLARNGTDTPVRTVLTGMARCARSGTAQAAGFGCYAKTGTASCSHRNSGAGDGFVIAMYPLDQPRHAILMMRHNTTGAGAAKDLKPLISRLGLTS